MNIQAVADGLRVGRSYRRVETAKSGTKTKVVLRSSSSTEFIHEVDITLPDGESAGGMAELSISDLPGNFPPEGWDSHR